TTDSLDTIGYFTSKYDDLERIFDIMRVHGNNFPISNNALTDPARQNKPADRPWNIAFVKTHTWENAFNYARDEILNFVKQVSELSDANIEEAELPAEMKSSHDVHERIYDKTLSYYFQEEFKKPEHVSSVMNDIIVRGNKISVKEYHYALTEQEALIHTMEKFFEKYDVIISLSTAGEAPLRDDVERPDPSLMWTLTHLPVISAPVFISPDGLPFGVQITARKYNDLLLFRFTDYLRGSGLIPEGVNPLASV
ncbi:MAG: amidase, partial [Bacteroidota bacterium]|nr:amidase [Bacteroidota bacterium]